MRAVIRRKWGDIHLSAHLNAKKSEHLVSDRSGSMDLQRYFSDFSRKKRIFGNLLEI